MLERNSDDNTNDVTILDTMDFSGMSLIKLKKEEMESQVRIYVQHM